MIVIPAIFVLVLGLVAVANLRRAIILMVVFTLLTPKGLALIDVQSVPYISANRAMVMVLAAFCMLRLLLNKKIARYFNFNIRVAVTVVVTSYFLTVLSNIGSSPGDVVTGVGIIIETFLPAYLVARYLNFEDAQYVSKAVVFCGILVAIYGIVAFFSGSNPYYTIISSTLQTGRVNAYDYADSSRGLRSTGTFSHPIPYGGFLFMLTMLFAFNQKFLKRIPFGALGELFVYALFMVAIYLTASRTPFLALGAGMLALWLWSDARRKIVLLAMSISAIAVLFAFQSDRVLELIDSFSSVSNFEIKDNYEGSTLGMRLLQFNVAFGIFLENPILGGGITYTRYLVGAAGFEDLYNTESALFDWGLNLGLLGLFAHIFLFFSLIWWMRRSDKTAGKAFKYFISMMAGYFTFILATGILDTLQFFLIATVLLIKIAAGPSGDVKRKSVAFGVNPIYFRYE